MASITGTEIQDRLRRQYVTFFSKLVLGEDYAEVSKVIYPSPRYKTFTIQKSSGDPRIIQEPRRRAKELQLKILTFLESISGPLRPCVHGFVKGRSIVTNAAEHVRDRPTFVLNLDLKDFFPSITFYRVRGVLQKAPFNLAYAVATVITQICTFQQKLPQGAPTSPFLSNLVCRSLDGDLTRLARRHRCTYTRYADDLTFSFTVRDPRNLPKAICSFDSEVLTLGDKLIRLIQDVHHFEINPAKTRMSTRTSRMEVTGLTINRFPNVRREFIDRIRGALHAWEKFGYGATQGDFEVKIKASQGFPLRQRVWKRQRRVHALPALKNVIRGRLLYIKMVKGPADPIYRKLALKFNHLVDLERVSDPAFCSALPISTRVHNSEDVARATFVIELSADVLTKHTKKWEATSSFGTGFAYMGGLYLVTCSHVLEFLTDDESVVDSIDEPTQIQNLEFVAKRPGDKRDWPLTLVHRDRDRDLAILRLLEEPPTLRYFMPAVGTARLGTKGLLVGFPNWTPGRVVNQETSVVTNRFARTALERFEIERLIRKGASGGPFLDESFKVLGIAQQGATQHAGNNECLCIQELELWLATLPPLP